MSDDSDRAEGTDWVYASRNRGAVQQQNGRGEWVPAIPLPLFVGWGLRRSRCKCGETFKNRKAYEGHYALVHILGLS